MSKLIVKLIKPKIKRLKYDIYIINYVISRYGVLSSLLVNKIATVNYLWREILNIVKNFTIY